MMNMKLTTANEKDIEKEAEAFKSIYFVMRSDKKRYKTLLDNLKVSAYRGQN